MGQITQRLQELKGNDQGCRYITTTLYELIEAINEELRPGEEGLLGRIVLALGEEQRIILSKGPFR